MTADPIWFTPPPRSPRTPEAPPRPQPATVALQIDGKALEVEAGATLLDACRAAGIDIPTLCFLATLTPANACRISASLFMTNGP